MKNDKESQNYNKSLLKVLPYHGVNIILSHGQFNNLLNVDSLPSKKYLEKLHSFHDLDVFSMNTAINSDINPDSHLMNHKIRTNYYSPHSFNNLKQSMLISEIESSFSILHNNVCSLRRNLDNFVSHLVSELDFEFDVIGITETRITNHFLTSPDINLNIDGYSFEYVPTPLAAGGVGMYINNRLNYSVVEKTTNSSFQALWIQFHFETKKNVLCGVIYRQHDKPVNFLEYLEEVLEKYSDGKNVYILGDFNIDLLKTETCNFSHDFLLSLQSHLFVPTIDKPSRVHHNSASLIDNIFTNNLEHSIYSGNIVSDISDHYSQFCITSSTTQSTIKINKKVRCFSAFSKDQFLKELSNIDFTSTGNVDQMFSSFFKNLNKIVNKHAPLKRLSKRKQRQMSKPWITQGIRSSIKVKNKLLMCGNSSKYKLYRNKISDLIRISKKLYFHSFFNDNIKNIRKTWEGINRIININKKKHKSISALKDPSTNTLETDPSKLPNIINRHFASVGSKLASKVPQHHKHFTDYLVHIDQKNSFFFEPVTKEEVELEIMATPNNKAYGLYSCPSFILKLSKQFICKPLSELINKSVQLGEYPRKLKVAKITPIFKSDDETDSNNYRPISLLSIFNRIFEKLIYKRLISFIEKHNLLYSSQYGFRAGHSTNHTILDLLCTIQTNMDKKLFTCAIFIDLKKAFDTVDHSILLHKLSYYGFRGIINDWFKSYLLERSQTVELNCQISQKEFNCYGVPQGSVLGPLLFLLYINDIYKASKVLKFFLFADDTNLLFAHKNITTLEKTVNLELSKLSDWLIVNKLTLNIKKSNFVIFRPRQKKINAAVDIKIFDNQQSKLVSLDCKDYVKYLGLIIDSKLSWKNHIDNISLKISKTIGLFAKLRHFVPQKTLLTLYWSLVHPYLSYGLSAWGQASEEHLKKLLILQKRVLRFIYFAGRRDSAIPLFLKANIPSLNIMYFEAIANLMHDVENKKAPPNICKLFTSISDIHSYNTRMSSSNKLYTQYSRTNIQKNSFSRVGVRLWNKIPLRVANSSKIVFKKEIRKLLFSLLDSEGYYVGISEMIEKFPKTKK